MCCQVGSHWHRVPDSARPRPARAAYSVTTKSIMMLANLNPARVTRPNATSPTYGPTNCSATQAEYRDAVP